MFRASLTHTRLILSLAVATILTIAGCSEWRNAEPRRTASDNSMKSGSMDSQWTMQGESTAPETTAPEAAK